MFVILEGTLLTDENTGKRFSESLHFVNTHYHGQ